MSSRRGVLNLSGDKQADSDEGDLREHLMNLIKHHRSVQGPYNTIIIGCSGAFSNRHGRPPVKSTEGHDDRHGKHGQAWWRVWGMESHE